MRGLAFAAAAVLLTPACSFLSPQTDAARFAVLASVDDLPGSPAAAPAASSAPSLGLGPVTLPQYLLRSEIVSRADGTRIVLSEKDRWAEPFDRAVERVLAIDLQRSLGAARVVHHPWYSTSKPDVQVEIAFSRCERDESGVVVVAARWSVRDLAGGAASLERESRIEREAPGPDGASTSLALSEALAQLSREIAVAWSGRGAGGEPSPPPP